jgi:hypothetical protein
VDGFKHACPPPECGNPSLKAVYVFGDPIDATLSLFRRGLQHHHSQKLAKNLLGAEPIPPDISLASYADAGTDRLGFAMHFRCWMNSRRTYPVLMLRYETLWEHVDRIVEYFRIESSAARAFPPRKIRATTMERYDAETMRKLQRMYGDFQTELKELDDCFELPANATRSNTRIVYLSTIATITNVVSHLKHLSKRRSLPPASSKRRFVP